MSSPISYLGSNPAPDNFGRWAKKRNIFINPEIALLVPTKSMGMGVFARRPLKAGTVVITCPSSAAMSPYDAPSTDSPCIAALQEAVPLFKIEPPAQLALRLMAELARPRSVWRPWLEACPVMPSELLLAACAEANSPSMNLFGVQKSGSASDADKTSSTSTTTEITAWSNVSQQLRDINVGKLWDTVKQVIAAYPQHWPASVANVECFAQCLSQVLSRNFHREEVVGREGPYLLPGLDVVNHTAVDPSGKFELRGGGRKHELTFTILTSRALRSGEQVMCNYGDIGSARFMVEFSFVTNDTLRGDTVRFSCETLVSMVARRVASTSTAPTEPVALEGGAQDAWHRVDVLQRMGILFDEGLLLHFPATTAPQDDSAEPLAIPYESLVDSSKHECSTLYNVVYLLFGVSRQQFDELTHRTVSRHWAVDCKQVPEVPGLVQSVLTAKARAATAQLEAIDKGVGEAMNGSSEVEKLCAPGPMKSMLTSVLANEVTILKALQRVSCPTQENN